MAIFRVKKRDANVSNWEKTKSFSKIKKKKKDKTFVRKICERRYALKVIKSFKLTKCRIFKTLLHNERMTFSLA